MDNNTNENTIEDDITFDELIEEYKKMSVEDKKKENIKELKELLVFANKLCLDIGVNKDLVLNREVLDIQKENSTIDDYLEAEYVYISEIKECLGLFAEKVAENFYE